MPGEQGARFRGEYRLQTPDAAKEHTLRLVDDDQRRPFAFFAEHLGVRSRAARGDPPIDAADVVAGLVQAYFGEVDATSPVAGFTRSASGAVGKDVAAHAGQRHVPKCQQLVQGNVGACKLQ